MNILGRLNFVTWLLSVVDTRGKGCAHPKRHYLAGSTLAISKKMFDFLKKFSLSKSTAALKWQNTSKPTSILYYTIYRLEFVLATFTFTVNNMMLQKRYGESIIYSIYRRRQKFNLLWVALTAGPPVHSFIHFWHSPLPTLVQCGRTGRVFVLEQ